MGDILTFEPRMRATRSGAVREMTQGAEILFFLGVRYEPYVEPPVAPTLGEKPGKRSSSLAGPRAKRKKRPA